MTSVPYPAVPGRTLLVLGGGGALGAYQAGALLALAEAGVVPDAFFGCSVGALNAAFLASDPGVRRAQELANWWSDTRTHAVLAPSVWSRLVGFATAAVNGAQALFDERPLRRLIAAQVPAHDVGELAVPLTVTTTCLDCGSPVHHTRGAIGDVLVASCALPGLFPPVRLSDGHHHVDGGVLCGVPVAAALAVARPEDRVLVLDCALAPVTGRTGQCAALPTALAAAQEACGLRPIADMLPYRAPVESHRGALQVVLTAFTIARAEANRGLLAPALTDPRVEVLPHVADAWSAGLLRALPAGPRDTSRTGELLAAGHAATHAWLTERVGRSTADADPRR
jgi:predicted acylesterase/phospholipase RssA